MSIIKREESINFRLARPEKEMIKRAADSKKVSESEYARASAIKQAEMDLADQINFVVTKEEYTAFAEALERPVQHKINLRKLLQEPSLLD